MSRTASPTVQTSELSKKLLFNYCEHDILKTMWNNEDFCDMAFIVDSTRYPVNRAIISAASTVLKTMLLSSFQEAGSQEIKIPDIGKEGFLHFVKYIYGYGIQIDSIKLKDLLDILMLSHQYDLRNLFEGLKSYVSTFDLKTIHNIMVSASSFIKLINAAFTYEIRDLYEKIKAVIQYSTCFVNNFLNNPKFASVSMPVLLDLLKSDHFNTEEIFILKSVLKWIDYNENTGDSDSSSTVSDSGYGPTSPEEEIVSAKEIVSRNKKKRHSGSESSDDNTDFTNDDDTVFKEAGPNENIKTLLNEIRWSLSKYTRFSKQDPLFQKYNNFLNAFKWSDDYKPRKQLHYHQTTLVCKKTETTTIELIVNCDKFSLEVNHDLKYDKMMVTLYYHHKLGRDILGEFRAICFNLILKSFHPFKNNRFLVGGMVFLDVKEDRLRRSLRSLILNASHPYSSNNDEDEDNPDNPYNASEKDEDNPDKPYNVSTVALSNDLLNSDSCYIENGKFVVEATIQYI